MNVGGKMKLRPATREHEKALWMALRHLKRARDLLVKADCPQSAKKVRSALKSAEGAERNMNRRLFATNEAALEECRQALRQEAEEILRRSPELASRILPTDGVKLPRPWPSLALPPNPEVGQVIKYSGLGATLPITRPGDVYTLAEAERDFV